MMGIFILEIFIQFHIICNSALWKICLYIHNSRFLNNGGEYNNDSKLFDKLNKSEETKWWGYEYIK